MTDEPSLTTGGCLCGAVRYEVSGPLRDVVNCHCSMCQRLHGNFGPHSKARKVNIAITKADGLAWYKTSEVAQRGFCRECGSSLFWEPFELDATGIIAGSLDGPTGLKTMGHIFVGEKTGLLRNSRWSTAVRGFVKWRASERLQIDLAQWLTRHIRSCCTGRLFEPRCNVRSWPKADLSFT